MMEPVTRPQVCGYGLRRVLCFLSALGWVAASLQAQPPTPLIQGDTTVCPGSLTHYSVAPQPGLVYQWSLSGGGSLSAQTGSAVDVQWEFLPGSGPHLLVVQAFDGPDPLGADTLPVVQLNVFLSCENQVHLSLGPDGATRVTPGMLLDGDHPSFEGFVVEVLDPTGKSLGDVVDCSHLGDTLVFRVTEPCTHNSCWGYLLPEDKLGPQFDCPADSLFVNCDVDALALPPPPVQDNCDPQPLVLPLGDTTITDDICDGVLVIRWWKAIDNLGNSSTCEQRIFITPTDYFDFPEDTAWTCSQYAAHPNITDPTPLTGDLQTTGSGKPVGVSGLYCNFNFSIHDDTIPACGNTFTIVRTWSAFNWCTGEVVTTDPDGDDSEQLIKIRDLTAPKLIRPPFSVSADTKGSLPVLCRSHGLLLPPQVSDACGKVTVRIFTPNGEAEYVNGQDGMAGGYIPAPGLRIGTHTVVYRAVDACGNVFELPVPVTVVDDEEPIPVCDAITDLNLGTEGLAELPAQVLDDGSTDNCCISHFLVKRMGEPDNAFAPTLTFDCTDEPVQNVVLRVVDCFGNFNECMVQVNVQDKIPPSCVPPPDVTISCQELPPGNPLLDAQWLASFGSATTSDNCEATVQETTPWTTGLQCGEGIIFRQFFAEDAAGNQTPICEQRIFVEPDPEWTIHFPANWEGDCSLLPDPDSILTLQPGCELLAVSYSDQLFDLSGDSACYKIVRTWDVINWCLWQPGDSAVHVPTHPLGVSINQNSYANAPRYTYQQIIKVVDNTPPTLAYSGPTEFCAEGTGCGTAQVELPPDITQECSGVFDIAYALDLFDDGSSDALGTGVFTGTLPIGTHRLHYLVTDGCGNSAELDLPFEVRDCKKPTPICKNGLVVELMQNGSVEVWAADLDDKSFDNCPQPLRFSFSADPTDRSRTFTCEDLATPQPVQLWVTDAAGNQDFCQTFVEIQDNLGACNLIGPQIAGTLSTLEDEPLEGAEVHLSGGMDQVQLSDAQGTFSFPDLMPLHDFTLSPRKTDDPRNGVTTYDLVLITRHILNTQPLTDPYRIIAADVNGSGSVTTLDLVEIRKLILAMSDEFPLNASWRFVARAYVFPDPANPFDPPFPETLDFNNLAADVPDADFVAVKLGDVNGSATPNLHSVEDRHRPELPLRWSKQPLSQGEGVSWTAHLVGDEYLSSLQLALEFDPDAFHFEGLAPLLPQGEWHYFLPEPGRLGVLWHSPEPVRIPAGAALFRIEGRPKQGIPEAPLFKLSDEWMLLEAVRENPAGGDPKFLRPRLEFPGDGGEEVVLEANRPNPFREATTFRFRVPEGQSATLRLSDVTGRLVWEETVTGTGAWEERTLQAADLPHEGIYFLLLESAGSLHWQKWVHLYGAGE